MDLKDGGKLIGRPFYVNDFPGICINRINLNADCKLIPLPVVNRSPFWNERNLNMMLLVSQLIELLLLQHLELKHSPDDQNEAEEEEARDKDDPYLEPIDGFPFHRITIT